MPRISRRGFLAAAAAAPLTSAAPLTVFIVPNFHPASCGWLTNFSKERVYCANSYFDHLDRVAADPQYAFALSEVNNLMAMAAFRPERAAELKRRIQEGRVELVNAFFLESTINLSGGEALVRLGIEGLRWQERVYGVRPRFAWTIDVCGTHEQMPQIVDGLGLDAMVYTRKNPTGKTIHWAESPDGTRALALSPGHYSELRQVMAAQGPLDEKQLAEVDQYIAAKRTITPEGAPILVLAGNGDYALAPARAENPSAFLREWSAARPGVQLRFATPGQYLDAVLPAIRKGRIDLPVMQGGTAYDFHAFWIQNPRVKEWYRRCEHLLAAAELAATAASAEARYKYPIDTLHRAWLQMFLNMDRNTLWGAAGGMVFEHDRSWDARDRFTWVEREARRVFEEATRAALRPGDGVALVNALSWDRTDPFFVEPGTPLPEGAQAHAEPDRTLCLAGVRAGSMHSVAVSRQPPTPVRPIPLPPAIITQHFMVRIDPRTGAIASLKLRPSEREIFVRPANVIVAERQKQPRGEAGDHMQARPDRTAVGSTSDRNVAISVWSGLATLVEVRGELLGRPCVRRMWFHENYPRIDCEVELNDVPDQTVVVAEFPLAEYVAEVRRGIPYGFSHGAWYKPNPDLHGWTEGITPAVRWSHYQLLTGCGFAIFDRGLSGRELNDRTPVLFLLNATAKYGGYPNSWLSGAGKHVLRYALTAHAAPWEKARIQQMAFEYNSPPLLATGTQPGRRPRWIEASDNLIVESVRRDGGEIEVRVVECLGVEGTGEILLRPLGPEQVWVTDMVGGKRRPTEPAGTFKFLIQPQQIVTLRLRTKVKVPDPKYLSDWDELVPEAKRAALHEYSNDKGHPPRGV